MDICTHFINHNSDKFEVAMVCCKMESCESLISGLINPVTQCLFVLFDINIILGGMFIDCFEAMWVIFECCKGQSCVHTRFLECCHIKRLPLLCKYNIQLSMIIFGNTFKHDLSITILHFNDRTRWHWSSTSLAPMWRTHICDRVSHRLSGCSYVRRWSLKFYWILLLQAFWY